MLELLIGAAIGSVMTLIIVLVHLNVPRRSAPFETVSDATLDRLERLRVVS